MTPEEGSLENAYLTDRCKSRPRTHHVSNTKTLFFQKTPQKWEYCRGAIRQKFWNLKISVNELCDMNASRSCEKAQLRSALTSRRVNVSGVCSTPRQTEHVRILGLGCHVISGEMIVTTVLTTGNFSRRESDGGPRRRIDHDDEP